MVGFAGGEGDEGADEEGAEDEDVDDEGGDEGADDEGADEDAGADEEGGDDEGADAPVGTSLTICEGEPAKPIELLISLPHAVSRTLLTTIAASIQ